MADEYTQQWQSRGKSRRERVEYARSRDILDVANELNMELFREGRDYRWKEHDSLVITPDKNVWNWFSRHQGGDVISLVEVMKEVDFNQAINFLNDGRFKERTVMERVQEPFSYYLAPYEQPFEAARDYLQNQRGLSAETIDFFLEKGVLAQANAKVKGSIEPVIVFKSFDFSGEIVGATLQGIEENWEKWTERGYAKNIMRNSDGLTGLHVDIGQPNRLIFAESAIDLMSYYELHKDSLQDVRLVSMDGLKEGVIGRHLAQLQSELSGRPLNWNYEQLAEGLQIAIDNGFFTDGKHSDWITLAVDNDEGGQNFISSLREKGAVVNEALPELQPGQVKTDWNDYLKQVKEVKKQTANEEPLSSFDNLSEEVMYSKTDEQEPDFDGFTTVSRIIIDDRTWNKSDPSKEISGTVVKVDAALISDIYPGYSVLFKYDDKTSINGTVYLGKRSRYDNKGNYDNRDNSLIVVSQNHAMLYLLESGELEHTREEMIEKGIHTAEDYQEFDQIVERLAKDYQMIKVDVSEQKPDVEQLVEESEAKEKAPDVNQTQEKALEKTQEPDNSDAGEFHRTSDFLGESSPRTASQPVVEQPQPDFPVIAQLYFTTEKARVSNIKPNYRVARKKDLSDLNLFAPTLQSTAQWYLRELANSKVHYFFKDNMGQLEQMEVTFQEKNFAHLAGISPTDRTMGAALHDFAQGSGHYKNIQVSKALRNKMKVLPLLPDILEAGSFVFNDLSAVEKLDNLDLSKAIVPEDNDLLVLFKDNPKDGLIPSSLMRIKGKLSESLEKIDSHAILGVYRERDGQIEQLSINEEYIKDGGQEMLSILENKQYEESRDIDDQSMNVVSSLDQNVITKIADNGLEHEKSIPTEIEQPIPQQKLESLRNYFARQMDKVETGIGHSGAGVSYVAYYLRNAYGNRIEIADTDLGNQLSSEEQLASLMDKIVTNYGKPFWDAVQHPNYEVSDEEANQLAYPTVNLESLSEVFGYSPDVMTEEKLLTSEPISADDFTKVLDAVYNVGIPEDLTRVPEEVLPAWQKYLEVSEENQWGLEQMVDYADENGLLVKDSAFYKEWQEDMIYKNDYHVRLQFAENWDNGVELPFRTEQLIDYKTFVTGLYEANQVHYQRRQENQLPYTKIEFDIYAPGGQLIKDNVHYAIGDETRPVSQLMGLGYRRLPGYQDLAAIDDSVLSQLENQELNQEIATEANEYPVNAQEIPQEDSRPRETFTSPKQDIKMGLAQRVEEIMAEDTKKQLEVAAPRVQEALSMEGDLVGTPQSDGSVIYTNREEFGQRYQIELTVYSPEKVDNLSETTAPWSIALLRGEENLGYLAYGSDWGNDFQIEEELEKLAEDIKANKLPKELYKQEEVAAFLANSTGQGKPQETTVSAEPFDYNTASAYEISERAFQKIREYTQSPEDLKAYMDFMSKFPRLSPRNVALIQEQWRGANAVATYNQWQAMGEVLDIKPEDVIPTKAIYTNKRTGETKEVVHQNLSVKTGEKSKITLFRPVLVKMIPVLDENGNQLKNDKGNPKFKKLSEATPQEKQWVKEGKLPVRQFQERDFKTGKPRYTTYKVFELSQTTLKPESYPKAMPNRHYNFNMDKVKTKEVLEGLCDYADSIGVTIMKDRAHVLDNRKGAFYPEEQLILINPDNTPGEKIATTIHELAHATLHNPKMVEQYKELPRGQREFEAEMTSHLLSKHFGLDTSEKAIKYMAAWTDNLKALDDKQLANSLGRVHKTVSKMLKQVESHTKPYQGKSRGQAQNFPRTPNKGMRR